MKIIIKWSESSHQDASDGIFGCSFISQVQFFTFRASDLRLWAVA